MMNHASHEWNHYLNQLHTYIQWQASKIDNLEKKLEEVNKELAGLQNKKPISIDKIEYRFDQLKIENLNGTLVIGVTPEGVKSIEDMAAQGCSWTHSANDKSSDLHRTVSNIIDQYVDSSVPDLIDSTAKLHQTMVNHEYRQHMISDLKKQMNGRIQYYMGQMDEYSVNHPALAKDQIVDKVKNDIHIAIDKHIGTLTKGAQHPHANDSH
ncbi:spore germination protein GerPC [Paenibacillus thiaminolyticus]|uniref:spore germination protein GerPC n=1 Tax=Paenibacillus thiaminolyticus TaxID=49283 RepID=UPI002543E8C9|nr:spore germination protein GerPC [Paenibacillus thiaminolyticus]WII35197.1 spore germination protein GerPC [Paenibacillus thiaminolyticus]